MRRLRPKACDLRAKSAKKRFRLKEALEPQGTAGEAQAGGRLPPLRDLPPG